MKIVKPGWISHDGEPIYSVDIQRGDLRFVTGGQGGNGSGLVIIWNLLSVIDENVEQDSSQPKILSRLENHSACVNCVRWSENGKYLATAGDDQYTMIWQYAGKNPNVSSLGKTSNNNYETWKSIHILRGHSGDILHLAWSVHDNYLASCSVDNTIIVWNARNFPAKIATLEGHTGFVKGVTWDPVGKYLASQSDDKSVKIWAVSNWTCIKTVKKPFEECGGSTHFLRLDWSSDGASLVSSHAMDNGGPVAKLITRKLWTFESEFVGHRKAVTCVRFSPAIYEHVHNKDSSNTKKKRFTVCAIGSKDRSISVWSTAFLRPVTILHNVFSGNVMDISWSTKSNLKLIACSSDGGVILLDFSNTELGHPLSLAEKSNYLNELYGKLPLANVNAGDDIGAGQDIVEDPRLLKLQNEHALSSANAVSKSAEKPHQQLDGKENSLALSSSENNRPLSQQIEIRTKDGRRKIQPIFLGSSVVTEDPALIQVESPDVNTNKATNENGSASSSMAPVDLSPSKNVIFQKPSTPAEPETSFVQPVAVVSSSPSKGASSASVDDISSVSQSVSTKPKNDLPKSPSAERPRKRKRRERAIISDDEEPEVSEAANIPVVSSVEDRLTNNKETVSVVSVLSVPERQSTLMISLELVGASRGLASIRCDNEGLNNTGPEICKISCVQNRNVLWQNMLNSSAVLLAASNDIVAVASSDCNLVVLSTANGRQLTPRIALDSACAHLLCSFRFFCAITSKGYVYVWNIKDGVRLVCKDTLSYLLVGGASVTVSKLSLNEFGDPMVYLSNGKSYLYSSSLTCWVLLGDTNDSLASLSSVKGFVGLTDGGGSASIVGSLTATVKRSSIATTQFSSSKKLDEHQLATLAYLENLINSALIMKSVHEYSFWILQYAQELVRDESHVFKLKSLCQDLLNDCQFSKDNNRRLNNDTTEGFKIDNRNLLNRVLSIVARNSKLQRVYSEFREQLDALNEVDFI